MHRRIWISVCFALNGFSERLLVNCLLPTTGVADFWPLLIVAAALAVAGVGFVLFQRLRHGGKIRGRGTAALVVLPLALGALLLGAVPAPSAQAAPPTCIADPGGAGTPTGPTPTPTPTVPPVCTPTVLPDIDYTFANWTIVGADIDSPALVPSSSLPELVQLRAEPGWVPADSQTTVSTSAPVASATAQSVTPFYSNSDGTGGLDQAGVLALASTIGVDNDFTVEYVTAFPYDDGCGNTLSANVDYTGFYHVAPAIPN
jgi:hypothetical protein